MTVLLVLQISLGYAIISAFDGEGECQAFAARYMAMLQAQDPDEKRPAKLTCWVFPERFPEPRDMSDG